MSKALYHVPQPGEKIRFKEISGLYTTEIVKSWDVKHGVLTTCEGDRYRIENRWTIKLVAPAPTATPKPIKADAPDPGKSAHRRPSVGDWVEVTRLEPGDIVKVGDVVKIIGDDHDQAPYHIAGNNEYCLRESQVKLTDKRPTDAPAPVVDAPEPRPRTEEHLFRDTTATIDLSALAKERGNIEFVPATAPYTTTLPTSFVSEVARAQAIADAEAEGKKWHEGSLAKYEEFAHKIAALIKEQNAVAVEDANAQQDHENRLEYLRSLRVRQDR